MIILKIDLRQEFFLFSYVMTLANNKFVSLIYLLFYDASKHNLNFDLMLDIRTNTIKIAVWNFVCLLIVIEESVCITNKHYVNFSLMFYFYFIFWTLYIRKTMCNMSCCFRQANLKLPSPFLLCTWTPFFSLHSSLALPGKHRYMQIALTSSCSFPVCSDSGGRMVGR